MMPREVTISMFSQTGKLSTRALSVGVWSMRFSCVKTALAVIIEAKFISELEFYL